MMAVESSPLDDLLDLTRACDEELGDHLEHPCWVGFEDAVDLDEAEDGQQDAEDEQGPAPRRPGILWVQDLLSSSLLFSPQRSSKSRSAFACSAWERLALPLSSAVRSADRSAAAW
ncbi:unnamed protein product [Sphagnum tenellum]